MVTKTVLSTETQLTNMLFSTKKIRNIALGTLAAVWMVSVLSLGMTTGSSAVCDPECPLEVSQKQEISYKGIEKKVVMLSGIVGWLSQYYNNK